MAVSMLIKTDAGDLPQAAIRLLLYRPKFPGLFK
jgi:hypothetical protein